MIVLKDLSVRYKSGVDEFPALDNICLELEKGDICAVIGPSGCGKSTLLHVLSGIIKDYTGEALISGEPINPKSQRIGFVPQNYGLLEWADTYANSILGLDIKHSRLNEFKPYIEYILEALGLTAFKSKYPCQLSGGQRQRVSIARSFILKPHILLMDEPFSALDAITREETQELFLKVWKENMVSTVFVTHSIEEAVYIGRKIIIMSPSPGRILREINNPLFGIDDLRSKDDYYLLSLELRRIVKEEWAKC